MEKYFKNFARAISKKKLLEDFGIGIIAILIHSAGGFVSWDLDLIFVALVIVFITWFIKIFAEASFQAAMISVTNSSWLSLKQAEAREKSLTLGQKLRVLAVALPTGIIAMLIAVIIALLIGVLLAALGIIVTS